jgi:hypothetical protein
MALEETRRDGTGKRKQTRPLQELQDCAGFVSIGRHLHAAASPQTQVSGIEWHRCWWMLFRSKGLEYWINILETFELMPVAGPLFR